MAGFLDILRSGGWLTLGRARLWALAVLAASAAGLLYLLSLQLSGKITFNEDAIANVSAPYPGIVKAVYKGLGDRVQKGEALALI